LVNRNGEKIPEPYYHGAEWKGWEGRLTNERPEEVVDIKKDQSPNPQDQTASNADSNVKREEDF